MTILKDVTIGRARLLLGDSLEIMPTLSPVASVVTDPPYGVSFRGAEWDATIPNWLPSARNLSEKIVFTTGTQTLWDYPRPDWVACWYRPASNSRAVGGGFSHWSPVVVYGKIKFPVDTIVLHAMQHAQESGFGHPSPKPIELMRWLVEHTSSLGETVLDPFMGSGTTGMAACTLGRQFIGIEREPEYFDLACRRIEKAQRQSDMFADLEPA